MQPIPWHPVETLRPEQASLLNRLLRRRAPMKAAGLSVTLCSAPPAMDRADSFHLRLGGDPATLDAPRTLPEALLAALDPAAPAAEPEIRRLLLELSVEDVLVALDRILPVEILSSGEEPGPSNPAQRGVARGEVPRNEVPRDEVALGLRCQHARGTFTARLRLRPATATRLVGLLDRLPAAPQTLETLRIPVHLRLGCCTLALDEARRLRLGDVLIPEHGRPDALLAVAGERLVWHAGWNNGAATVTTPRQTAAAAAAEEWMMGEQVPATTPDAALDELPVRLLFEVGRSDLTVAELAAVAPGHVFTVPGGPPGRVDILANGRRIGQGELVQLGDGTGVRLLSLVGKAPGQ